MPNTPAITSGSDKAIALLRFLKRRLFWAGVDGGQKDQAATIFLPLPAKTGGLPAAQPLGRGRSMGRCLAVGAFLLAAFFATGLISVLPAALPAHALVANEAHLTVYADPQSPNSGAVFIQEIVYDKPRKGDMRYNLYVIQNPKSARGRGIISRHWSEAAPHGQEGAFQPLVDKAKEFCREKALKCDIEFANNQATPPSPPDPSALGLKIEGLRFYESGKGYPPRSERVYSQEFPVDSRFINWELQVKHPKRTSVVTFPIKAVYRGPGGKVIREQTTKATQQKGATGHYHEFGYKQTWVPGSYQVSIFIGGQKVASKGFRVVGEYDIPSLQARVTKLRFYRCSKKGAGQRQRVYATSFPRTGTTYICHELGLKYPAAKKPKSFELTGKYYGPDGRILKTTRSRHTIKPGWRYSSHRTGWGWPKPGKWPVGSHRAEFFVDGAQVASGTFEITSGQEDKGGGQKRKAPDGKGQENKPDIPDDLGEL
jgi:hypothetical protein